MRWRNVPKPAGGWAGEPVDLLLELRDLVTGLAQGLGEPLVLAGDRRERALGVGQPELDGAVGARRVAEAAPQVGDLGLQEAHLPHQLLGAARALGSRGTFS